MTTHFDPMLNKFTDLSVVIIARNESANIARAIESVLRATENWPQTEVLLVDSASTDNTVNIAKHYPINIVRIPSSWFLSVGAGRLIGMHYTRGELVLHMDGDAELDSEWVNCSVPYMLEHPDVAAVGAYYRNIYMRDGRAVGEEDQFRDKLGRIREVKYVGCASLYRRSAIEKIGGFQPFIKGEEGIYLCLGLRHAGYKIIQLPVLGWKHYCVPLNSLAYNRRRMNLNMWLGFGQMPRYYLGTSLFWMYVRERSKYTIAYLAGLFISIISLLFTIFTGNLVYFGIWFLVVSAVILAFTIRKRSFRKALLSLLTQTQITYCTLRGFCMKKAPPPSEYPINAEIIQVGYHKGGLNIQ